MVSGLTASLRVMLIEDDLEYVQLIQEMIAREVSQQISLGSSDSLSRGMAALVGKSVDVLLLDLSLPDSSGMQTITQARELARDIPIVVLTHREDEDFALQALDAGAQDYLIKGKVDGQGLLRSMRYAVERKHAEEERERLLEEWTAVVAHDLSQPVTVILGYAELLKQQFVGSYPAAQRVESILTNGRRLIRMIEDLLDASRLDAHHLTLAPEPVDLPHLVRSVAAQRNETMNHPPVRIVVVGKVPTIKADSGRLEQVLDNLLSNAAKYGEPNTEIMVEIVKRRREVEVSVTNYGDGIPADELSEVFDRFTRTRGARRSGRSGLGLGLYIVKGIVEAHGGRVWATSKPGETTSFHFMLPV